MTNEILLRKPKSLSIIEKDNNLAKDLSIKYYDKKTIEVHNLDILKFNIEEIIKDNVIKKKIAD